MRVRELVDELLEVADHDVDRIVEVELDEDLVSEDLVVERGPGLAVVVRVPAPGPRWHL